MAKASKGTSFNFGANVRAKKSTGKKSGGTRKGTGGKGGNAWTNYTNGNKGSGTPF
jgi:hypothetical protein